MEEDAEGRFGGQGPREEGAAASWLKVKDVPGIKSVVCKSLAWVRPRGGQLKLVGGTLEGAWWRSTSLKAAEEDPADALAVNLGRRRLGPPGGRRWPGAPASWLALVTTGLLGSSAPRPAIRTFAWSNVPEGERRLLSVASREDSVVVGGSDGHLSHWDLRGRLGHDQ